MPSILQITSVDAASRRHFLQVATTCLGVWIAPLRAAEPDDALAQRGLQFRWAVRSTEVAALRQDLNKSDAKLIAGEEPFKPTKAEVEDATEASFAPLMVIAGAVALSVVLEAVLNFYQGIRSGGGVIKVRDKKMEIGELRSLPNGAILVLVEGQAPVMFEANAGRNVSKLIAAVAPGLK